MIGLFRAHVLFTICCPFRFLSLASLCLSFRHEPGAALSPPLRYRRRRRHGRLIGLSFICFLFFQDAFASLELALLKMQR